MIEPKDEVIEVNIGSPLSPKIVKIGKNTYVSERQAIEDLVAA